MSSSKSKPPGPRKLKRRPRSFVAAWMRSPLSVGSLVPSSYRLAEAIAAQVDVNRPGSVVELGPGTGVVTHALLHHGVPVERLIVIERNKEFHALMVRQFPD